MGNVVSTVEVIVDVHLPVAMDIITAAIEIMQLADAKRSNTSHHPAKEFIQRYCILIEIDEYETLPGFDADWEQSVLRSFEIFDTLKLRHSLQRSVQTVLPSVIGTLQNLCLSTRLGYYGSRVVTANIEKCSE